MIFDKLIFLLQSYFRMTSRQDEVRIVQLDPDGNVVYQGASERETTVRLFDTSLRPLSSTAEKLLKIIAEDQRRTPGPGSTAARPTSGWWNGQPVDQGRSAHPRKVKKKYGNE